MRLESIKEESQNTIFGEKDVVISVENEGVVSHKISKLGENEKREVKKANTNFIKKIAQESER